MSGPRPRSVLFVGKADDKLTARALARCRELFADVQDHLGRWGDALPEAARTWEGDLIVSYLSRWVLPASLLQRVRIAALNFHPGPPEYPGYGCNNFALYEEATRYGVTCHHMAPKVDTGAIVAVERFGVEADDDVGGLLQRAYAAQAALFERIITGVAQGQPLPVSHERWTRPPTTRREFDALFDITPNMSAQEIARRVRATTYGPYRPRVKLHGFVFELSDRARS